ncbi:hypothetical protein ABBQ38_007034 [Trebouxia sp. C0009 RCD-2024]
MTAELLNASGRVCRPIVITHRKASFSRVQALSRRGPNTRCDLTNQNSSQRASSSQGASCSGRQWLSSSEPNQKAAQSSVGCKAKLQESDLQLPKTDGSGNDGPGNMGGNGSSGGGGGDEGAGGEGDEDDEQFLNTAEAEAMAARKGIALPQEFLAAAAQGGLRQSMLLQYAMLQAGFFTRFFSKAFPAVRNRLLSDPKFLFKIGAEVAIDAGCATVAEVRKRGDDFWGEFEFYLSDLVVGCVLDCVLVGLLAPSAVIGAKPKTKPSGLDRMMQKIPSAVFEASLPGVREYGLGSRVACLGIKFLEYSLAGMFCGFLGQGVANGMMLAKRKYYGDTEGQVKIPSVTQTALVWGLFMGTSSNVRYQTVFGLERAVDLTIAKRIPQAAYVATILIRFVNNIIGGENFIDMARWAGVQ